MLTSRGGNMLVDSSIGIIVPCHNEEQYLRKCLESIDAANSNAPLLIIADRCTDLSREIALDFKTRHNNTEVLVKNDTRWKSSIAENLEIGLKRFLQCEYISVVDADVLIPRNFFKRLVQELESDSGLTSVASALVTDSSTRFNRLYAVYEKIFRKVSIGQSLRGCCRVYRGSSVRSLSKEDEHIVGDYLAQDTKFDQKLGGRRKVVSEVVSLHSRHINLAKCIRGQLFSGRARRQLHSSFIKTIFHSILRLRPFLVIGYLEGE